MKTSKSNFRFVVAGLMGLFFLAGVGMADTYTQGFEGDSYDLAGSGAGTATLSTAAFHSGSQSVLLSLQSSSDYARVKLDVTAEDLTLEQITSADYWINKSLPALNRRLTCCFPSTSRGRGRMAHWRSCTTIPAPMRRAGRT